MGNGIQQEISVSLRQVDWQSLLAVLRCGETRAREDDNPKLAEELRQLQEQIQDQLGGTRISSRDS